jgi:hypothetical protein
MTTATPLLVQGPLDHRGRAQLALVLLEAGRPAGGFRNGKEIDATTAQALLQTPAWRARA